MKDLSIYFTPREKREVLKEERLSSKIIVHTETYFPELDTDGIALIECPEYRGGTWNKSSSQTEEQVALLDALYELHVGDGWNFAIYDLGTLLPGNTIEDTYFALSQVVCELIKHKITPVILGGGQDLTFPVYKAYQQLEQMVNIAIVDTKFDLGSPEDDVKDDAYITPILMSRPCYLFNCSNIGIQAPYVKKSELDLYEKLYFDVCRLGEFNSDFKLAEPYLRNSDFLSLDINAIRFSDYQDEQNGPNGFYAEQVCQIAKYAGISDKLTCFGIFNIRQQESNVKNLRLVAELLWYFMDGFSQRKGDFPIGSKKDYLKFNVHLETDEHELVFFKSPKSDRWWLEVPYPSQKGLKYERHYLVPCNYEDYEAAMKNEIPDLWWKTQQKLA